MMKSKVVSIKTLLTKGEPAIVEKSQKKSLKESKNSEELDDIFDLPDKSFVPSKRISQGSQNYMKTPSTNRRVSIEYSSENK
jgi:hypothetical protein